MFIDELNLSGRVYNCMMRNGIRTIEKLQQMSMFDLRSIRGLGEKGIQEIKEKMER